MTYCIEMEFAGATFGPIGPYETKADAYRDAKPYLNRDGWTVEIIEKDEPFFRDFV